MARITQADLDQLVTVLRNRTGNDSYRIEYAYGRPRLYQGDNMEIEVSPRLPKRELYQWIDGYIDGCGVGFEAGRADAIAEFAELGITLEENEEG
jgi:hypothetical protein